jgi:glycine/D-amino acid oxidase-like deaminating enzyme
VTADDTSRITVCTRPFRNAGPRLDVERLGDKTVVHNYGHGGNGWSLSWGSGAIAAEGVLATGEHEVAVLGCGGIGLTTAILQQHLTERGEPDFRRLADLRVALQPAPR